MTQPASTPTHPTTLVLGAHGKTGRRVAQRLTALGWPVRAGSRGGRPPFDWELPGTWDPALAGVGAVYVSYQPDLLIPGASDVVSAFVDRAVAAGVRRIVLLSARGSAEAQAAEAHLRGRGVTWTVLRSAFMSENLAETWLEEIRGGTLSVPAADNAEPLVDVDDIADVATAALTDDRHHGRVYELTGPRPMTFHEVAAELSAAVGREVRYQPVGSDELAAGLVADGMPAEEAGPLATLLGEFLDGHNASLGDGVQQALGRAPRDVGDFIRAAAAAGTWERQEARQR